MVMQQQAKGIASAMDESAFYCLGCKGCNAVLQAWLSAVICHKV
jgi:hypothetical protein